MHSITKINENIHRLTLPYKDIFTTVYTLRCPEGVILFDAASFDTDGEQYILPFLQEVGVAVEEVRYVFISHNHTDHSGGLNGFLDQLPNAIVLSRSPKLRDSLPAGKALGMDDGQVFMDTYRVVTIPGHTKDCSGLLDLRTKTLICGDCLQSYGICGSGTWAANIGYPDLHVQAIEKVRKLDIEQIVTAHDYKPHGFRADGREAVLANLEACIVPLRKMQQLILANPQLDDKAIQAIYNVDPQQPKVKDAVIGAMRLAMEEGRIAQL